MTCETERSVAGTSTLQPRRTASTHTKRRQANPIVLRRSRARAPLRQCEPFQRSITGAVRPGRPAIDPTATQNVLDVHDSELIAPVGAACCNDHLPRLHASASAPFGPVPTATQNLEEGARHCCQLPRRDWWSGHRLDRPVRRRRAVNPAQADRNNRAQEKYESRRANRHLRSHVRRLEPASSRGGPRPGAYRRTHPYTTLARRWHQLKD